MEPTYILAWTSSCGDITYASYGYRNRENAVKELERLGFFELEPDIFAFKTKNKEIQRVCKILEVIAIFD